MTETTGSYVNRTFAASPAAVFDAWVTPSSFAVWWGGDDMEVPLDSVEMDVRPGGTWKATVLGGNEMPDFHFRGEYLEVDRPNKLVMTLTDEPGDEREILTVILTEVDGGTEMQFSQTGGHLTPEQYEGTAAGWGIALTALENLLAV
nr:SRPBCC domain-containing protein [Rhodococcus sp. (in: high G+C Gram-positive bacteria)]